MAVGCVVPDSRHRISAWEMGRAMGTLNISNWHFIAVLAISAVFSEVHANAEELVEHWQWLPQLPGVYCVRYVCRQKKQFQHRAYIGVFRWETTCNTVHVRHWLRLRKQVRIVHIMQFVWGWVSSIYCRVCSVWGTSLGWGNSSLSGISNDSC